MAFKPVPKDQIIPPTAHQQQQEDEIYEEEDNTQLPSLNNPPVRQRNPFGRNNQPVNQPVAQSQPEEESQHVLNINEIFDLIAGNINRIQMQLEYLKSRIEEGRY